MLLLGAQAVLLSLDGHRWTQFSPKTLLHAVAEHY